MSLSNDIRHALTAQGYKLEGGKPIEGDLCDLCRCTKVITPLEKPVPLKEPENAWDRLMGGSEDIAPDPDIIQAFVKAPRAAMDEDLVKQEQSLLSSLWRAPPEEAGFLRYLPRLHTQGLAFSVIEEAQGYVTLAEVMAAYPEGLDYRDMAWMLKRVLAGVGYAHEKGVVHGALIPEHLLVHPTGHGAKLIDWCYGVRVRDHMSIRAYVAAREDMYPPEVFDKAWPTPATDIYMIGKCFEAALHPDSPVEVLDLLTAMTATKRGERPQEAWALHDEFDGILRKLVGKPKYRPLSMPVVR